MQYTRMLLKLIGVSFIAMSSWAASVASVSASGRFKLSGVDVPATAAASVPVSVGDAIATFDTPAIVRFENRAVITLYPKSSLKLESKDGQIVIRLTSGSLHYKLEAGANLTILNRNNAVGADLEATIVAGGSGKTLPIALGAAGAGAGIGAGVALTRPSKLSSSKP